MNSNVKGPVYQPTDVPVAQKDQDEIRRRVIWNPWVGMAFVIVLFFGAQLLGGVIISIYPLLKGWSNAQANEWLSSSVGGQFAFILITEAITILAIYLFLRIYKATMGAIGLHRPKWRDLGVGLMAVPAYFVLYFITLAVATWLFPSLNINQHQDVGFTGVHGWVQLSLTFVSLVILPPLAEEIMIRGFLYSNFKKIAPTFVAVIGTSFLFASAHLPEGGSAGPLYVAAIDTFVLSLVLIYLREKTGSLWASITLHACKNGVAFLALYIFVTH
jgi:membrane protease YdiL (CAAX protease family)